MLSGQKLIPPAVHYPNVSLRSTVDFSSSILVPGRHPIGGIADVSERPFRPPIFVASNSHVPTRLITGRLASRAFLTEP